MTISGNTITGNSGLGGISLVGLSAALIENNVITGNTGGGVRSSSAPTLVNNTIVGNTGAAQFQGSSVKLVNNVLVGTSNSVVSCSNAPAVSSNDVWNSGGGTRYAGSCTEQTGINGDLSADPGFMDAQLDFHLGSSFPAIDAGTATDATAVDRDGTSRPLDGNGDAGSRWTSGAYERGVVLTFRGIPPGRAAVMARPR